MPTDLYRCSFNVIGGQVYLNMHLQGQSMVVVVDLNDLNMSNLQIALIMLPLGLDHSVGVAHYPPSGITIYRDTTALYTTTGTGTLRTVQIPYEFAIYLLATLVDLLTEYRSQKTFGNAPQICKFDWMNI